MKNYTLYTSESVTEGHPDKVCDLISDALLDAYLSADKDSHVAMETMASKGMIFLSGEVSSRADVDVERVVRDTVLSIGYDSPAKGMDGNTCQIVQHISRQSPDIAQGVNRHGGVIGAGDQGMMYGYACDETEELMPLSISLAHRLARRLTEVRKSSLLPYLYPDGKTQVTVAYDEAGNVAGVTDIVISAQHCADADIRILREDIQRSVIDPVIPPKMRLPDVKIHINPTGRFVVGGPEGDTGLTGRKIIVDTYGGIAHHGGGAFSGKDPTKVDRSAAYMARYAAKNVVAAQLCKRCELQLAYAIGLPDPVSVRVDAFGTEEVPRNIIEEAVRTVFDFSVSGIIEHLGLQDVKYTPAAAYGHFGRDDQKFPWERVDKVPALVKIVTEKMAEMICNKLI